jgi:hypothetical protein
VPSQPALPLMVGSRTAEIAYHQAITPAYTHAIPPLGGLALIATLAALVACWSNPPDRRLTLGATECLLVGLVVTVVVHFPINAEIATWQPAAVSADWHQVQRAPPRSLDQLISESALAASLRATAHLRPAAALSRYAGAGSPDTAQQLARLLSERGRGRVAAK